MGATLEDLQLWVAEAMKKENCSNYELDISGGGMKGDGYLGEVVFLNVSTSEKCYKLVVKCAKKADALRKITPLRECYEREIFMYSKVFPLMLEYQLEKNITDKFTNFAKCYSICSEEYKEAVVLENIKSRGFELHDRLKTMNLNHVHLMFKNYAKFHGMSFVLRHQKPAVFNSLIKNMSDVFGKFFIQSNLIDSMVVDFKKILKLLKDEGEDNVVEKFNGFEHLFKEVLTNSTFPENKTSVILHGDCWNNNMMFKYDDGIAKPTEMCFLDFQLSRVASPVFDLSYFLYACSDAEVLKHIQFLLQTYYTSLSEFVKQFEFNIEEIFTFDDLKSHWKVYGKYGLFLSLFIVRIELCEGNEAPDFEDAAATDSIGNIFDFQMKNQHLYEKRIKDVFVHFAEHFL